MSWSPPGDVEASNPALDPFRERAGVLQGDGRADYVFLESETQWSRAGGHLWWSRWSAPREVIRVHLRRDDGQVISWVVSGEDLDAQVSDWQAGLLRHEGTARSVEWQDDEESERIRDEICPPH